MYRSQSGAEQQHLLQQQHHQQQQQFGGYPQVHNQQQQQQQQSQESSVLSGSETMTDYAGIPFPSGEQQHYNHDSQQRDSIAGPSRGNNAMSHHGRAPSLGGGANGAAGMTSSSGSAHGHSRRESLGANASNGHQRRDSTSGPYSRPEPMPTASISAGPTHTVKASSTTSEFTKRKNWSQHIIDEIQDFMHVLSPTGDFIFVTPSVQELLGWTPEEIIGTPISSLLHADDLEAYRRDINTSIQEGQDLTLYARLKNKDDVYVLFEITGHPYYAEHNGQQSCKCFFAMGRPYPSKNQAMLDSFLELKFENERLRQELQVLYKEIEGGAAEGEMKMTGFPKPYDSHPSLLRNGSFTKGASSSVIDPVTGLVQTGGLLPSSSNTYGALGIGISESGGSKADGSEKKKKKPRVEEGEFVCRDCGTVDSPEWRKGPDGPKSLCNACGLRYAKLTSKAAKAAKAAK